MAFQMIPRRFFTLADFFVLLVVATLIYAVVSIGQLWQTDYHPVTEIDLSVGALPRYALFSAMRGFAAYLLSLIVAIVVGYAAAQSKLAEMIFLPLVDILQSMPVLGFLPGIVLGLIALFPNTNIGLELAAIIMIFTSQAWNMIWSFYQSLKSMPSDYREATKMMGFSRWQTLTKAELPYSAVDLAWNSLMSMAGGWFFLTICEAFTLGHREFRLPGVGAYMALAINQGNTQAIINGIIAMLVIIIVFDFVLWHPILSWVRRFRSEDFVGNDPTEPLMLLMLRESKVIRLLRFWYRRYIVKKLNEKPLISMVLPTSKLPQLPQLATKKIVGTSLQFVIPILLIIIGGLIGLGFIRLIHVLGQVTSEKWVYLSVSTIVTFMRVMGAVILSALWTIPVGIWIGLDQRRIRIAQPIIQLLASFPAPMLYPLILVFFLKMGINFNIGAMFLMMFAVQWYVLFNVLPGALRISKDLSETMTIAGATSKQRWRDLYLPSVFPAVVPGLIAAAGGAWNGSIVAEYIAYKGEIFTARGLGADISMAAADANFPVLAAALTLMVIVVVILNRSFWAYLYNMAQNRYRMDM